MKKNRHTYPFCSIIILNYQGEKIITQAIHSLQRLDYPQKKYEIIVVDNCSTDSSLPIINKLARSDKKIKVIRLDKNYGFSKGNNFGIRKSKGEYIAFLNNDCTVEKKWLRELVKVAVSDDKIFAVNSKIILHNSKKIQNAGILVFQDGYGRDIGAKVRYMNQDYEYDQGQYNKVKEVYAACAASSLYKKSILEKISYFDESFFMYYEDVELSERARLHGYKIYYSPHARCYHIHAASSKEGSSFFIYHVELGRLLHVFFHFPFAIFLLQYVIFNIVSFGRFVKDILHPKELSRDIQYLKVIVTLTILCPYLIYKRVKKHKDLQISLSENYQKILTGYWYFN